MKFIEEETNSTLRASQGWLKDYYGTGKSTVGNSLAQVPTEKNFDLLYQMYSTDATIFATINTFVNKATSNGYRLESDNKQQLRRGQLTVEKLNFDTIIPNILKNMVVYGDAFVELEYAPNSSSVVALHVLETTQMEIISDEHGEVKGYRQVKGGKDPVNFTLDECVHFKWLEFGGRLFGTSQIKTLMGTVATKKYAETFNRTGFQNFAPRLAWIVKNGSEEQVKQFTDMLKLAKEQPHKDIVVNGDVEFKPLMDASDSVNYIDLQKYLREQLMMTTQVPPIMLGLPDNSNRSNAEAQMRAFESNVKAIQKPVQHTMTYKLFPLLGLSSTKFIFNPLDKRNEKDDLEIAQGMAALGLDDETILYFLKGAGIDLREGATIKKPEPLPVSGEKLPNIGEDKAGRKKDNSNMKEQKTGSESTTREDQLRSWESQILSKSVML